MKVWKDRKILLIGIGFYDYEKEIATRLRERGAVVTIFTDLPYLLREGFFAAFARRFGLDFDGFSRLREKLVLKKWLNERFDQILVIKGTKLSIEFLDKLRLSQPAAEFIMYQWDSVQRLPGLEERLPFFDRIFSFDLKDVEKRQNFIFRPLFYRESGKGGAEKNNDGKNIKYDIAFVGWLHSDRLSMLKAIQKQAHDCGLKTYFFLRTGFYSWFKLFIKGDAKNVRFWSLNYKKLVKIHRSSRVILDLPHPLQSGLTMRAIEALGYGNKLMTISADIVRYDFYTTDHVYLIDDISSCVDLDFVIKPLSSVPCEIRQRYSLDSWIDDVFCMK